MNRPLDDLIAAQELDAQDELAAFRDQFVIADPDLIYLDGNSLGRLPRRTADHLRNAVETRWGERLIRSWNEAWVDAPARLGAKIARLVGAQSGEVLVTEATSINLFKLAAAALRLRPGRGRIVSDVFNFPSDLYILQGLIDLLGGRHHLHLIPSRDGIHIDFDDVEAAITEDTALVSLSHVAFKSAYLYDMSGVTELAQRRGSLVLWDLSHSVGAVPVDLNGSRADLAVGCTYKYLNGGPGAPAFLYVRQDLQAELISPLWGWFADRSPFEFNLDFQPDPGIARFRVGTPPVLSMEALDPALDLILEAGMERLRSKSLRQTEYLIRLADEWLAPLGFSLGTPRQAELRGSHVSLRHSEGYRICRALIEAPTSAVRVIPDFRTPDNIRLGITPLYTSYTDIYRAMSRLRQIALEKEYERYSAVRQTVT